MLQKAEAPAEPLEGEMDKSLDHPQKLSSTPLHHTQVQHIDCSIRLITVTMQL